MIEKVADPYEAALSDSLADDPRWTSMSGNVARKAEIEEAARSTLAAQRQRISIAVRRTDLAALKALAARDGMPYQTLINSILHRYVNGTLRDAD